MRAISWRNSSIFSKEFWGKMSNSGLNVFSCSKVVSHSFSLLIHTKNWEEFTQCPFDFLWCVFVWIDWFSSPAKKIDLKFSIRVVLATRTFLLVTFSSACRAWLRNTEGVKPCGNRPIDLFSHHMRTTSLAIGNGDSANACAVLK